MWKFDNKIAEIFPAHARQHIPNYDKVIQKSLDICNDYPKDAAIVDVGCAVGETLVKLYHNGFTNLYGVDNSSSMLDRCPKNINAKYILTDSFTMDETFDVVIINWTLHFIKNKKEYLSQVKNKLRKGGTLIISDKTSNDEYSIKFYHKLKHQNGVSASEIIAKQQSVENIMNIDPPVWYFDTFEKLGFTDVYIFDADWCFTSFVCK